LVTPVTSGSGRIAFSTQQRSNSYPASPYGRPADHVFRLRSHQDAAAANASAAAAYRQSLILTGVLILTATVVATVLALVITRSITVPIQESVKVAETVAMGDLSAHIDAAAKDEPAQLQHALRQGRGFAVASSRCRSSRSDVPATSLP
jgi:methyl-accepting chemotaxis protein